MRANKAMARISRISMAIRTFRNDLSKSVLQTLASPSHLEPAATPVRLGGSLLALAGCSFGLPWLLLLDAILHHSSPQGHFNNSG
jgi:hypothetical protein